MKQNKSNLFKRFWFIALAAVVAFAVTAGAAYIKIADVKNNFNPAVSIIPDIFEDFDGTVKENVYFNVDKDDDGKTDDPVTDYPVYVRAAIVITWQDENGIVYYLKPTEATPILNGNNEITGYSDGDYIIDINLDDWTLKSDGFYYYKEAVESNGNTTNFINLCKQIKAAPVEGYTLSVEILVQTVQAVGYTDGEENAEGEIINELPAWEDAGWMVS